MRTYDYDGNDDRPRCGICSVVVTPANFAAWDRWDVFCVSCQTAAEFEYGVYDGAEIPTEAEYHRPMACNHALRLAVETIMGARTLLNGGGGHPDDEAEDETTEIGPESMDELVNGRRTEAA